MLNEYGHGHPSLFYFVAGNEDWGNLEDADWRTITAIKNGQPVSGLNGNQLILCAHDYLDSGGKLIQSYGHYLVNATTGSHLPRNQHELILTGYEHPVTSALMMGEFGGKSYAPPGVENVFG